MKKSTRRALFLLALAAFVLIAPAILLYAFGYRPPQQGNNMEAVGGIYLRTFPRRAQITLNGRTLRKRTPAALRNLPVGEYTIKLTKPRYRAWEKTVKVEPNIVTEFRHIVLLPEHPSQKILFPASHDAALAPDRRLLLAWTKHQITALYTRSYLREDLPQPPFAGVKRDIIWNDRSTRVAISWEIEGRESSRVNIYRLQPFQLEKSFSLPPRTRLVSWHPIHPDRWFEQSPEGIFLRDLNTQTRLRLLPPPADISVFHNGTLALLPAEKQEGRYTLRWYDFAGNPQAPLWPPLPSDFNPQDIIAFSPEQIALRDAEGKLLVWQEEWMPAWKLLSNKTLPSVTWSARGTKLLWQTNPYDLWVFNLSDERSPLPLRQPALLLRRTQPIRSAAWFAGENHIIYTSSDVIRLIEADPRGKPLDVPLAQTNLGEPRFIVGEAGEVLYYWKKGAKAQQLVAALLRLPEDASIPSPALSTPPKSSDNPRSRKRPSASATEERGGRV
jgi:hypothetical protein